MEWYYESGGDRKGPVGQAEFARLVKAGTISGDTLVWRRLMTGWRAFSELQAEDPAVAEAPADELETTDDEAGGGEPVSAEEAAAPAETADESQEVVKLETAALWRRLFARAVDLLLFFFVWGQILQLAVIRFFPEAERIAPELQKRMAETGGAATVEEAMILLPFTATAMAVGLAWNLLYEWIFVRLSGSTPGKRWFGIEIRRSNGQRLTSARILLRHIANLMNFFTLGFGWLVAVFDAEKRGLHDHLCDTRVVKRSERR